MVNRGDVVLIPFPFTDFSALKTRPAVIVSSNHYHQMRPEILIAYVSSQISIATPPFDCILQDWQTTGLLKPSFVRPKIAAIDPSFIVHHIGPLSLHDLTQVNQVLKLALAI